jgi:cation diffusion facilitator family transporter
MIAKIGIGLAFGSVAVLGDGVDSAEDVVASAIAFFTVRLAMQPADESHPYGHGKAESLAAMSQAALIAAGAAFIIVMAIYRLATGGVEIGVAPSLITMGVTVVANLGVAAYSLRAAKISGSVAIASDARHLLTNVVQAATVIAGLALVSITGSHAFDPAVALLLAAYLLWIAFRILGAALSELVDSALPEDEVARLEECLRHEAHGVRGFHALRTRKSGREKHIDVHVLLDPTLSVSDAHRRVEDIERDVRELIPGSVVSIHIDPDEPDHVHSDDGPVPEHDLRLHRH